MIEHIYATSNLETYILVTLYIHLTNFPGGSAVKNLPANAGDLGLISGPGRFPGEGNGYPLQDFMIRGAWQAIVHGVAKERM